MEVVGMITLEDLKNMEPKSIFATGTAIDDPEGINMSGSCKLLRWVAVRGGMHDWTIYCGWDTHDELWLARFGDKIFIKGTIRRLVECDDEAFNMYRY